MADIWDDDENFDGSESDKRNPLRDVVKDLQKKLKERDDELKTLRPAVRKQSVANILKDLKVTNPKIAGLVPSDIDPTPEAIKAWVDEYGDVFGATTTSTSDDSANTNQADDQNGSVDEEVKERWQRIQSVDSQSGVTTPDKESEQIAMLMAASKAAGNDSDLFGKMLRGETQIPN